MIDYDVIFGIEPMAGFVEKKAEKHLPMRHNQKTHGKKLSINRRGRILSEDEITAFLLKYATPKRRKEVGEWVTTYLDYISGSLNEKRRKETLTSQINVSQNDLENYYGTSIDDLKNTVQSVQDDIGYTRRTSGGYCGAAMALLWLRLGYSKDLRPAEFRVKGGWHAALYDKKTGIVVDPTASQFDIERGANPTLRVFRLKDLAEYEFKGYLSASDTKRIVVDEVLQTRAVKKTKSFVADEKYEDHLLREDQEYDGTILFVLDDLGLSLDALSAIEVIEKHLPTQHDQKKHAGTRFNDHNFNTWFAGSKVLDVAGNPLIVYRGTPNKGVSTFNLSRGNRPSRFFFTASRSQAVLYSFDENKQTTGKVVSAYLAIKNPYIAKLGEHPAGIMASDLIASGYDGIYAKEQGWWIAFFPNQIQLIDTIEKHLPTRHNQKKHGGQRLRRKVIGKWLPIAARMQKEFPDPDSGDCYYYAIAGQRLLKSLGFRDARIVSAYNEGHHYAHSPGDEIGIDQGEKPIVFSGSAADHSGFDADRTWTSESDFRKYVIRTLGRKSKLSLFDDLFGIEKHLPTRHNQKTHAGLSGVYQRFGFKTRDILFQGDVIGRIQYRKSGKNLYVQSIDVDVKFRRKGFASYAIKSVMKTTGTNSVSGDWSVGTKGLINRLIRDGIEVIAKHLPNKHNQKQHAGKHLTSAHQKMARSYVKRESLRRSGKKGYAALVEKYGPEYASDRLAKWRKNHPSSIVLKVRGWMNEMSVVNFEEEVKILPLTFVDFKVGNKVIEVDGKGWHVENTFFGENRAERDRVKEQKIKELGYEFLRLNETSIRDGSARSVLQDFLGSWTDVVIPEKELSY